MVLVEPIGQRVGAGRGAIGARRIAGGIAALGLAGGLHAQVIRDVRVFFTPRRNNSATGRFSWSMIDTMCMRPVLCTVVM